jgi:Ca2+-binding RTX toxin-like protein
MASILTGGPASPGVNLYSLLFGQSLNPGPTAGTETSYTFSLPGSLFVTVSGSAFTYSETGALTAGTIETYTFKDATGRTLAVWNPADAGVPFVKTVWSFGGSAVIDVFLKEDDTIVGSAFGDYLVAGLGNDTVDGGGGHDELLFGQDGRMIGITVDLNDGNAADAGGRAWAGADPTPPDPGEIDTLISIESIWATEYADLLIGDAHDNAFTPGLGSDTVDGGDGYDEIGFIRDGRAAGVTVDLNDGNAGDAQGRAWSGATALPPDPGSGEIDILTSIEAIWATNFADRLIGDGRDNSFTPGLGSDTVDGGLGRDEIYYNRDGRTEGITVDLAGVSTDDDDGRIWTGLNPTPPVSGEIDEVKSIESIWATRFADLLIGDSRGTTFTPDAGKDTIHGGLGEDVLDYFRGSVTATTGLAVTFSSADGGTVHQDSRGGTDAFTGIEIILASSLADHVTGADGRQWIVSFSGDDWFDGRAGGDVFQSGAGNDTFRADSTADVMLEQVGGGNDRVLASATHALYAGQEIERLETISAASKAKIDLYGNEFANLITGNNGANVLDGGKGVDTLAGHGGNDT